MATVSLEPFVNTPTETRYVRTKPVILLTVKKDTPENVYGSKYGTCKFSPCSFKHSQENNKSSEKEISIKNVY